jgi:hypothetical protein
VLVINLAPGLQVLRKNLILIDTGRPGEETAPRLEGDLAACTAQPHPHRVDQNTHHLGWDPARRGGLLGLTCQPLDTVVTSRTNLVRPEVWCR